MATERSSRFIPSDPLFRDQWHFLNTGQNGSKEGIDINIVPAWGLGYSGRGLSFGIYDDGVDASHPDLVANYDSSKEITVDGTFIDPSVYKKGDDHGTAVAGLVSAVQGNGIGVVGGSFGGKITGVKILGAADTAYEVGAMNQQSLFDVTNHSWGFGKPFSANMLNPEDDPFFAGLRDAAANGRNGLGTIQMVAAGNERIPDPEDELGYFSDTNTSNFTASRFVNAIGAIDNAGKVSWYSTPGAALLVTAPSSGGTLGVTTTDYSGLGRGYKPDSDYTDDFGGTSAATPIASGAVGLMLEANPLLGYRDVMEILAITARQIGDPREAGEGEALLPWAFNGAKNWNNGGMHFSHDYGYGLIDTYAAVKLAETWGSSQTLANEASVESKQTANAKVTSSTGPITATFDLGSMSPLDIEAIEVEIDWSIPHARSGDLIIELISPSEMTSYLLDRAGGDWGLPSYTFMTRAHFGEQATGVWTVKVTDVGNSDGGVISGFNLRAYGSNDTDDSYFFTNEFSRLGLSEDRQTLTDADGGVDTINAAAVEGAAIISLGSGSLNEIGGSFFRIQEGVVIENAIGTSARDMIFGNGADNFLQGGRGDDGLFGNGGKDQLKGGMGDDFLYGNEQGDHYIFEDAATNGHDRISYFAQGDKLQFTAADYGLTAGGDVPFEVSSTGAKSSTATFVYNPEIVTLFWDADGVGALEATPLVNFWGLAQQLSATDFVLV